MDLTGALPEPVYAGYFLDASEIGLGTFATAWIHPKLGSGWLVLRDPVRVLEALDTIEVRPMIAEAESEAAKGRFVAGFLSYDAAPAFDSAFHVRHDGRSPLACFHVYSDAPLFYKELVGGALRPDLEWSPEVGRDWF